MKLNIEKLNEIKEKLEKKQISIEELPQEVLAELFILAVQKIDYLETIVIPGNDEDERDIKDITHDQDFIVVDLFNELIKNQK